MTITREKAFTVYLIVLIALSLAVAGWFYVRRASSDISRVGNLTRAVDKIVERAGTEQAVMVNVNSGAMSIDSGTLDHTYRWRQNRVEARPLTPIRANPFSVRQVRWDRIAQMFRDDPSVTDFTITSRAGSIEARVVRNGKGMNIPVDAYFSN
ncbi:MAG: hypothetical protein L0G99_01030 [Propionibacteriales bacterium]|nr:hypothetical protein [Propionibacteriales bacterium]